MSLRVVILALFSPREASDTEIIIRTLSLSARDPDCGGDIYRTDIAMVFGPSIRTPRGGILPYNTHTLLEKFIILGMEVYEAALTCMCVSG